MEKQELKFYYVQLVSEKVIRNSNKTEKEYKRKMVNTENMFLSMLFEHF